MRLKWLKNEDGSITPADMDKMFMVEGKEVPRILDLHDAGKVADFVQAVIEKNDELMFAGDEKKHDGGKAPMDLLPWDALEMVAQVMAHGAKRYGENSWQGVERRRYEAAMLRHYSSHKRGGTVDSDSGLLHLAHMACNAIFILALEIRKNEVKGG